MNFALSDEQMLLREAARGALSRFKTVEAAREALENPDALPDLWPTAVEAGWPGLLIDEAQGGAGLGTFDALLVAEECGRLLESLGDGELRSIALWKMEGYTTEEMAAKLKCAPRTIERKLRVIRRLWKQEVAP